MDEVRTAQCACGDCAITVAGAPILNGICNCTNCKARTGSGFGWNAYFPDERVTQISGRFEDYHLDLAQPQTRSFCQHCGTTLFWKTAFMPGHIGIAGGCFQNGDMPEPTGLYASDQQCAWLTFPESWPRQS